MDYLHFIFLIKNKFDTFNSKNKYINIKFLELNFNSVIKYENNLMKFLFEIFYLLKSSLKELFCDLVIKYLLVNNKLAFVNNPNYHLKFFLKYFLDLILLLFI